MERRITITDQAAKRIREILEVERVGENQGLRLRVLGGGPAGPGCEFSLDAWRAGDRMIETSGARVLIDVKSLLYLRDAILDFKEDRIGSGFAVRHPGSEQRCGCAAGSRFSPEAPELPEIW